MTTLAVTGGTGRLGGRVARRLAESGVSQRLLLRDVARAPHLPSSEVHAIPGYADDPVVEAALSGIETLFMVSATEAPDRREQHLGFVDAAARAGVEQVIYLSFSGADAAATFTLARDHGATEAHIRASGMQFTFLRDNLYADFFPSMVGADGVLRGPAGSGRVAAVAQDDIADAAAAVLRDPARHRGRTYDLTGPQALTLTEVAEILSQRSGRSITYYAESVSEAYESRAVYHAPDWQLDAWVSTYTAIAAGAFEVVSPDNPTLTGHSATSLREVLQRN